VPPEVSLTEAFDRFVDHDRERLVVSNSDRHRPIGSISKTDLILALAGRDPI
jgi:CBS domain-containing protein